MNQFDLFMHIVKLRSQNHIVLQDSQRNYNLLNFYGNELKNLPFNKVSKAKLNNIVGRVMKIKHQIKLDALFEKQEHQVILNLVNAVKH